MRNGTHCGGCEPQDAPPTVLENAVPHGGNVGQAVRRYGIARTAWLDLSTGISPHAYPVPAPSASSWHRLPDDDDALAAAAARCYGAKNALPVAGSQAAIRMLPLLLARGVVGMASLTYGEYEPAFARAGHRVEPFVHHGAPASLPTHWRHVVVVNPNNPTADSLPREWLLQWRAQLAERGGCLIVDEAFCDAMPETSVAAATDAPGLVVLRSLGKFFGLAGARVGFVLAEPKLLDALRLASGAWCVAGPAREVALAALEDHAWQGAARESIRRDSARLQSLLRRFFAEVHGAPLFAWVPHPQARILHDALARQAVWVRLFEAAAPGLRLGLPGSETDWLRLERALAALPETALRRLE